MEKVHNYNINESNELMIGNFSAKNLVETYQTPLYVMDEHRIVENMKNMKQSFSQQSLKTEVIFAGKAFLTKAMVKLIKENNLSLDVVSIGELYTAISAGFDPKNIYFHGNNKTEEEIVYALNVEVGTIIIDHKDEFELLSSLATNYYPHLLLRINTGVEAHTHEYIKTTHHNSKFGVSAYDDKTLDLINMINQSPFDFMGIHAHIGSQIFEISSFQQHTIEMIEFSYKVKQKLNVDINYINLGGGFGIKYTDEDRVPNIKEMLKEVLNTADEHIKKLNLNIKKLMIEPGRSIVADAGVTLYSVGSLKTTYGQKNYIFVDGSMADHMRTALYQAKYEAVIANRVNGEKNTIYTIAGKACESGDMIIHDIKLPEVKKNDIIAVFTTGAYHYSMASNYNRLLKPAVIFVNQDKARIVVKRETLKDLIRNDL
ncbi:diaminopimelate decarboxylase [Mycoplasmatota bacterium]|nr:diaminopimelate decarboxylase [Mycoplasmatota bacterium]